MTAEASFFIFRTSDFGLRTFLSATSCRVLVRRLVERLEQDVPALAVGSRSAGEGHCHGEVQRGDLPPLLRPAGLHRNPERLQQVIRRLVIAVRVLSALG